MKVVFAKKEVIKVSFITCYSIRYSIIDRLGLVSLIKNFAIFI